MVKKCLLTMGIFTIIAICFIYILVNLKYQNEWITYKPDLKSRLENNRDCLLCGENSKVLWDITGIMEIFFWYIFQPGIYGQPIFLMKTWMRLDPVV